MTNEENGLLQRFQLWKFSGGCGDKHTSESKDSTGDLLEKSESVPSCQR